MCGGGKGIRCVHLTYSARHTFESGFNEANDEIQVSDARPLNLLQRGRNPLAWKVCHAVTGSHNDNMVQLRLGLVSTLMTPRAHKVRRDRDLELAQAIPPLEILLSCEDDDQAGLENRVDNSQRKAVTIVNGLSIKKRRNPYRLQPLMQLVSVGSAAIRAHTI